MSRTSLSPSSSFSLVSTGLPGLDELLGGGFMQGRAYQVRGRPGAGKTILGWHYLTAPVRQADQEEGTPDESVLLITFDEPAEQHCVDAQRVGLSLDSVDFLDLSPTSDLFAEQATGDLFLPSDFETGPISEKITETVQAVEPSRIVVDTMSHLRHLSADPAQYRRQALSFLRFLKEHRATVVLLTEWEAHDPSEDLLFLSDGIIELKRDEEHSIRVVKQRGQDFRKGDHSIEIGADGMQVYPRLFPDGDHTPRPDQNLSSGVPELDELMGGGIGQQTMTIVSGTSGVGKTTLALQFMREAAGRGERAVLYSFEENRDTLLHRAASINLSVDQFIEQGTLAIKEPRPWTFDTGAFAQEVRNEVEEEETQLVVIDSLAGYQECRNLDQLRAEVHRLRNYLISHGATGILINELQDITGTFQATERGVSHLADTLIFLRYLEMQGELRKAIGVLKKRTGDFEKMLREFQISSSGIKVGVPLTQLRGVLTGTPEWVGDPETRVKPIPDAFRND